MTRVSWKILLYPISKQLFGNKICRQDEPDTTFYSDHINMANASFWLKYSSRCVPESSNEFGRQVPYILIEVITHYWCIPDEESTDVGLQSVGKFGDATGYTLEPKCLICGTH